MQQKTCSPVHNSQPTGRFTTAKQPTFECICDKVETGMNCNKTAKVIVVIPFELHDRCYSNLHNRSIPSLWMGANSLTKPVTAFISSTSSPDYCNMKQSKTR